MIHKNLQPLFSPASVVIIGATDKPEKPGYAVLYNLINSNFKGKIYPINPGKPKLLGIDCSKSIEEVDGPIDLALIVIPAAQVTDMLERCGTGGCGRPSSYRQGFGRPGRRIAGGA